MRLLLNYFEHVLHVPSRLVHSYLHGLCLITFRSGLVSASLLSSEVNPMNLPLM